LVIAEKSAVRSSTPTSGLLDDSVLEVVELDDFESPPHAATTKSAVPTTATIASPLHAERKLPPSL
jgi:hypothetical protein